MEYNDKSVPKKHDLLALKDLVSDFLKVDNEDMLETLNSLYIESRYPGNLGLLPNGKPAIEDAEEFYDAASTLYEVVKTNLEKTLESNPIDSSEIVESVWG